METEQFDQIGISQKEKSGRTIVIAMLVLFLGGLVYFISQNQAVHFSNKAAGATKLDESQSKQVMVLGYTEAAASSGTHKLRIEIPHSFAFVPESITIETGNGTYTPKNVTMTPNPYTCHDMGDPDHPMMGYETTTFTDSLGDDLDTKYVVTFTDTQGKRYESTFELEHTCTVLGKDSVQPITPPTVNDVPNE